MSRWGGGSVWPVAAVAGPVGAAALYGALSAGTLAMPSVIAAILALLCAAAAAAAAILLIRGHKTRLDALKAWLGGSKARPARPPGKGTGLPVVLRGLRTRQDLNGQAATLGSLNGRSGRWVVRLSGGGGVHVLPDNIEVDVGRLATENSSEGAGLQLPPCVAFVGGVLQTTEAVPANAELAPLPAVCPALPAVAAAASDRAAAAVAAWAQRSCREAVQLLWEMGDGFGDEDDGSAIALVPPAIRDWAAKWLAVAPDATVPTVAAPASAFGSPAQRADRRFCGVASLAQHSWAPSAALFGTDGGIGSLRALHVLDAGTVVTVCRGPRSAWTAAERGAAPQQGAYVEQRRSLPCPEGPVMSEAGSCEGFVTEHVAAGEAQWRCAQCGGTWAADVMLSLRRAGAYKSFAALGEQERWIVTLVSDHRARPWHYSLVHHIGTLRLAARRLGPRHWTAATIAALMVGPAARSAEGSKPKSPASQVVVQLTRFLCAWARDIPEPAAGHDGLPALLADEERGDGAEGALGVRAARVLNECGEPAAAAAIAALTARGMRVAGPVLHEMQSLAAHADPAWPAWRWTAWSDELGELGVSEARVTSCLEKLGNACDHCAGRRPAAGRPQRRPPQRPVLAEPRRAGRPHRRAVRCALPRRGALRCVSPPATTSGAAPR
eukprot:TRINITY_DN17248_c0_g1_i2.p1 TRINITY_DN17248_c0_g1~~TRINITY_DN17248_c0_g1_i2.p1  ORF type:complete len:666 (+),score=146.35 TRINITY_DN17248_c0_g1_i2:49-2046(+)